MLSSGPKVQKISGISDAIFPARHPQKSSQHVPACAAGDGAICSKNRKIVPYHGANPNTRNGARLRSLSPIMAPDKIKCPAQSSRCRKSNQWNHREQVCRNRQVQNQKSMSPPEGRKPQDQSNKSRKHAVEVSNSDFDELFIS